MKPLLHLGGSKGLEHWPTVRTVAEYRAGLHLRQKVQHFLRCHLPSSLDGCLAGQTGKNLRHSLWNLACTVLSLSGFGGRKPQTGQNVAQHRLCRERTGQGRNLLDKPARTAKGLHNQTKSRKLILPRLQKLVQFRFQIHTFREQECLTFSLSGKVLSHQPTVQNALVGRVLINHHQLPLSLAEQVKGEKLAYQPQTRIF